MMCAGWQEKTFARNDNRALSETRDLSLCKIWIWIFSEYRRDTLSTSREAGWITEVKFCFETFEVELDVC